MVAGEGFLTTHILDTAKGCPAEGIRINVYQLYGAKRKLIKTVISNGDGRTDEPIIAKGRLEIGTYELVFAIGDYFFGAINSEKIPFLDLVPIQFGVSDVNAHYHVPLLASPYSYSTYRGS